MIGYLEMDSGHEILWACRIEYELQKTLFILMKFEKYHLGKFVNFNTWFRFQLI